MIDFSHILHFASQLPHPSDIGLVKPSGGFNLLASAFGILALIQVSQFIYYGKNDPSQD